MALRTFQRPLAIGERRVFVGIVWGLYYVSAAGQVEVAILGAVDFVAVVLAIVLFVALEFVVNAVSV